MLKLDASLRLLPTASFVMATLFSDIALAHTLSQKFGTYEDNQGLQRERVGVDGTVQFARPDALLTNSSLAINATRDYYDDRRTSTADGKYNRDVYGASERILDAVTVNIAETWNRLTETRVLGAMQKDEASMSRTFGGGVSQWLIHETLQASLDVSRTFIDRPANEILDVDIEPIHPPARVDTTGTTLALKHLSTPTTISLASVTRVDASDRPATYVYGGGVRQFIKPIDGAVHVNGSRAVNRGTITTDTTYGEVSAWQWDFAYLQTLWQGAFAKANYRYYREDQVTRVTESELVMGSDTFGINFAQELPKGLIDGQKTPLVLQLGATRYATNSQVNAAVYELGVQAKF